MRSMSGQETLGIDDWYNVWNDTNDYNDSCVIRVTNKCNEQCQHCCFRSGPLWKKYISTEKAIKINQWLPKKITMYIMGGEFTVLKNYPEIILALTKNRKKVRLATNGQWATTKKKLQKFVTTVKQIKKNCNDLDISISDDQWHISKGAVSKYKFIKYNTGIPVALNQNCNPAPIGRAWDNKLVCFPEMYALCKTKKYLIITEDSMIHRCSSGYFPWKSFEETTWDDARDYIWRWRSEKLSEGMNCHICMEIVAAARHRIVGSEAPPNTKEE